MNDDILYPINGWVSYLAGKHCHWGKGVFCVTGFSVRVHKVRIKSQNRDRKSAASHYACVFPELEKENIQVSYMIGRN